MIYDLSQPVFHDAPHWCTYPSIRITLEHRIAVDGFNAEHVKFTTHSGTHIDAPFHFVEGAATVDELPLDYFVAPASTLDDLAVIRMAGSKRSLNTNQQLTDPFRSVFQLGLLRLVDHPANE